MSDNMANRAKNLAEMVGVSYEDALKLIRDFERAICNFDSGRSSLQLLADSVSDIIQDDEEVKLEQPLWVKRQQKKHFKRGKN